MYQRRRKAITLLTAACFFWGLSFPVCKALNELYAQLMPGESTWFLTGVQGTLRFIIAGIVLALLNGPSWLKLTKGEIIQGVSLGLSGGLAMIFQIDGLNYTRASSSAFLTQAYCVILPIYYALRHMRFPTGRTIMATMLVLVGVGILSKFNIHNFSMGRGEAETLLCTLFFTAQILETGRERYLSNRAGVVSAIMMLVIGLLFGVLALCNGKETQHYLVAFQSGRSLVLVVLLALFCTALTYGVAIYWQRFVSSTEAGLIYTAEPLFASIFALLLPTWIAGWIGVTYQNESFSMTLLAGGGLIISANLIMQLQPLERGEE